MQYYFMYVAVMCINFSLHIWVPGSRDLIGLVHHHIWGPKQCPAHGRHLNSCWLLNKHNIEKLCNKLLIVGKKTSLRFFCVYVRPAINAQNQTWLKTELIFLLLIRLHLQGEQTTEATLKSPLAEMSSHSLLTDWSLYISITKSVTTSNSHLNSLAL